MKCMKCHNTLHSEIGEFSMTINGKSIKVINAPVLHCKNCNSVIISDEVKEKAKEFSKVYLKNFQKYIYIQTILLITQNVKPERLCR